MIETGEPLRESEGAGAPEPPAAALAPAPGPVPWKRDRAAGRAARRIPAICAYVGANGSGKSLAMVHDTLPSLDAGRLVYSTVRLIDPATGLDHPAYRQLNDWSQILDLEHADLLFDEVVGIAGSREAQGLPVQVQNLLVQLRRRDLVMRWTAPNWARADKIIREVTQSVTLCSGTMRQRSNDERWAPKRLFRFQTFDTVDFDEWSLDKSKKLRTSGSAFMWGPGSRAFASYDSLGQVQRIGEVLDSGRCAHCGGRRSIPVCRCGA